MPWRAFQSAVLTTVKSSLQVDVGHKQRLLLAELTMQLRQDAGAANCESGLLRATVLDRQTIQTCQENMGKDLPRNRDERDGTMATAFSVEALPFVECDYDALFPLFRNSA